MMTCKQATALLSHSRDGRLAPHRRLMLRLHLLCCAECRRHARQFRFLSAATRRLGQRCHKERGGGSK